MDVVGHYRKARYWEAVTLSPLSAEDFGVKQTTTCIGEAEARRVVEANAYRWKAAN